MTDPTYYSYNQKEVGDRGAGWYYEFNGALYGPYLAKRLAQYAQQNHE